MKVQVLPAEQVFVGSKSTAVASEKRTAGKPKDSSLEEVVKQASPTDERLLRILDDITRGRRERLAARR